MRKRYIITILIITMMLPGIVNGQVFRDRIEKGNDRQEIRSSKKDLKRDQAELENYQALVGQFRTSWIAGDQSKTEELQQQLVAEMDREILQSRKKLAASEREVRRSKSELSNSNRDLRQSRRDRSEGGDSRTDDHRDFRDDRRDRRDDVKDLSDDRRDRDETAFRVKHQEEIRERFADWDAGEKGSGDIESMTGYKLLQEFSMTMDQDIRQTREELGEDTRELREDRRELREDRRERREDR